MFIEKELADTYITPQCPECDIDFEKKQLEI